MSRCSSLVCSPCPSRVSLVCRRRLRFVRLVYLLSHWQSVSRSVLDKQCTMCCMLSREGALDVMQKVADTPGWQQFVAAEPRPRWLASTKQVSCHQPLSPLAMVQENGGACTVHTCRPPTVWQVRNTCATPPSPASPWFSSRYIPLSPPPTEPHSAQVLLLQSNLLPKSVHASLNKDAREVVQQERSREVQVNRDERYNHVFHNLPYITQVCNLTMVTLAS